jgi:hypothetical protein
MIDYQTIFSPDRAYRYTLWRSWQNPLFLSRSGFVMFVGLNPSIADETINDPTVRRCIGFAAAWGFSMMCMTNIFAFRTKDPRVMKAHPEPVGGPENDRYLLGVSRHARETDGLVVAAWGIHGTHLGRNKEVINLLGDLECLGYTKRHHPRHPLFLRGDLEPIPYARNGLPVHIHQNL